MALAVAVVATATLVLVAALQAQAAVRRQVTDRSGRVRQVAALGTVVLTVAAAAVSVTQLLRYGSPLVSTPGGLRTDPTAAAAPALALAALAVAAMAVLGPATRLWAALAGRSRGVVGPLAARQVARRIVVYVVPVVLLVLAGGAATLAGGYTGTAERLRDDVDVLTNGADVRVTAPESGRLEPAPYLPGGAVRATTPWPPPRCCPGPRTPTACRSRCWRCPRPPCRRWCVRRRRCSTSSDCPASWRATPSPTHPPCPRTPATSPSPCAAASTRPSSPRWPTGRPGTSWTCRSCSRPPTARSPRSSSGGSPRATAPTAPSARTWTRAS